jgi:hypothetical protein
MPCGGSGGGGGALEKLVICKDIQIYICVYKYMELKHS